MMRRSFLAPERTWVLVFALGVVALTAIPYVMAASQPGGEFTGFLFGVEDGNSYIAKMLSGAQGDWLFRSPYTTTEQSGALIYLPYLLLGKLLGPGAKHDALAMLYHVFRSVAVILVCFSVYDFLSYFIADVKLRRLGLGLITLGGGLGWITVLVGFPQVFGSIPLEFYSPEAFGFLSIFGLPHLVFARALLFWGLLEYLRAGRSVHTPTGAQGKGRGFWWAGLLWLAMALTHLITAGLGILLMVVHFAYLVARDLIEKTKFARSGRQLDVLGWSVIGVLPVVAFDGWAYMRDSYLQAWAAQNQIVSPSPMHFLIAYGLLLPFACFGLRRMLRAQWMDASFLLSWLIMLPILLYAPVGLQRRLSEGAWAMLIVLALFAYEHDRPSKPWTIPGTLRTINPKELWLFAMAFPSTLMLLVGSWQVARQIEPPIFRPADEVAAFEELRRIANHNDVVLSSYETGNALPAWVPVRVLAGHGPESDDLQAMLAKIRAVYDGSTSENSRLELLREYSIAYIFWGPAERSLGSWAPANESYLELIVQDGAYEIYVARHE